MSIASSVTQEKIRDLVPRIDYSEALTVTATPDDAVAACRTAVKHGFRAVVSFPCYLELLVRELSGTGVLAQLPIGFPSGAVTSATKRAEAEEGLKTGASDFDMMMNIGALKARDYARVSEDIKGVAQIVRAADKPLKVIIEVGLLTDEEIVTASKIAEDCGATHVKTCTGFNPGRATMHAIALIRNTVGDRVGIKASGGVASLEDAVAFMDAGATVVAARLTVVQHLEAAVSAR
ncbi:MAG: deoxyribose-phosphate aldolase [Spirochaetaceae bacterium]|nr:MAG: deoxyribose-phosphate aldolase [Spirochaetaceae bacterium]